MQPVIDPAQLRPRRFWYGVAAGIAVLGLAGALASVVVLAHEVGDVVDSVEALDPQLRPVLVGRATTVDLDPGQTWAVYASSSGRPPAVSCGGEGLTVTDPEHTVDVTVDGASWREVQVVRVQEPGPYEIVCSSTDRTAHLSIGRAPDPDAAGRAGGHVAGAVVAALLVLTFGGIGVLAGGLVALVVGVRRSRHRATLLAQGGYGPYQPSS